MLMWKMLYVRPVIGKCICTNSWSNYELATVYGSTGVTIKLYHSCI